VIQGSESLALLALRTAGLAGRGRMLIMMPAK
jgi:hypothetical protein